MNIGGRKRRGRPIYVTSGDATISLVPEITLRQWRVGVARSRGATLSILRPFAVYLINSEGVHRLNFQDMRAQFRAFTFVTALLAPLLFRLVIRKNRRNYE